MWVHSKLLSWYIPRRNTAELIKYVAKEFSNYTFGLDKPDSDPHGSDYPLETLLEELFEPIFNNYHEELIMPLQRKISELEDRLNELESKLNRGNIYEI